DEHWFWDVTRWEIQLRFRKGAGTWLFQEGGAPQLTKYKQGYFVEWRLADRYKAGVMATADYWVDANDPAMPRRVGRDAFWGALRQAAHKPFHMQAYFDPSVWGGQWMKRILPWKTTAGPLTGCRKKTRSSSTLAGAWRRSRP
nr:mannose-6-phosphate isomerase [Clostridia bacterium]